MRIEIGPHYGKLLDTPDSALETKLRNKLSYELPGAEFAGSKFTRVNGKVKYNPRYMADTRKYLYDKRTRKFPAGLIDLVLQVIPDAQVSYPEYPETREEIELSRTPRYYQSEAHEAAKAHNRGVIILPTGTGKTLLCAKLASSWPDQNILITVPNLNLLNQSRDELEKMMGIPIGILGDNQTDIRRITVATIQSLVSKHSEPVVASFLKGTTVWVADECHGTAADSYTDLSKLLVNCNIRFGVTATWMREDGKEMLMQGILGRVIYEYSLKQAMADGYLCPVNIMLRHVDHKPIPKGDKKPTYKQVYKTAITENDLRSDLVVAMDVADLITAGKTPCLVIVNEIEHGKRLSKLLGAPFISGQEKSREKRQAMLDDFESGKTPVLIGSSVMNVGVDVPTIKSMINAASGKSLILLLQRIGRALRIHPSKTEVTFVDYIDHQPLHIEDHANTRKFFYTKYFSNVKEITIEPLR
jgi:superfamily II DNA or RNA helicase